MTFSFCPSDHPQFHARTARRLADRDGLEAFPCPFAEGDHWHVSTGPDDELLLRWRARAERRRLAAERERLRRSEAMVEGFKYSGM